MNEKTIEKCKAAHLLVMGKGMGVKKACKEVGVSTETYYKWLRSAGEPKAEGETMNPGETSSPSSEVSLGAKQQPSTETSGETSLERFKRKVEESERNLSEYLIGEAEKTEFEKKVEELLKLKKGVDRGLRLLYELFPSGSVPPTFKGQPRTPEAQDQHQLAEPQSLSIEHIKSEINRLEKLRRDIRNALEELGFKVEDVYMRKDEVEKLIEDAKRKAAEEAIDDKRIDAVKAIVQDAIAKVVDLFRPAVNVIFSLPSEAPSGESESRQSSESSES